MVEPDFSQCPGSRFPFESFLFIRRLIVALWGGISPGHPGIEIFSSNTKCWRYTLHVNWSPSTSWLLSPSVYSGCFTTYYSFNKIVLDVITEKFGIQVDENTRNQATLLHDDIPGYDLPTIDFGNTTTDQDEDVSILEEDNSQTCAHLKNVLVHMIDKQQIAIFKSNQDFNKNKQKISQYMKYAENWQVASVICSYTAMACDVLLIIAMIAFLLKYRKTMQAMLTAFLQTNIKNTAIQSVQADQIGRTYPPLFTINL